MKKQIIALVVLLGSFAAANAQGGMQRQTPEERTKATMEKLVPLNLNADQLAKTTVLFTDVFIKQQKAMEEMRAGGTMDREAMMAKRKEMNDARDVNLKLIFTTEQFKKFKDEIEPAMIPQPRNN